MSSKYICLLLPAWALLLQAFISCKSDSNGNSEKESDMLQPIEIIFRVSPNLYCTGASYTVTEKSIHVEVDEEKPDVVDSAANVRSDCGSKVVFQKVLTESDALERISRLEPDDLEAIPHEGCEGGVSYAVTLKKNGKTKQIIYMGCAKRFDRETKNIVKFINSQVPKRYRIDL